MPELNDPITLTREFGLGVTSYQWIVLIEYRGEAAYWVRGTAPDADLAIQGALDVVARSYPDSPALPPDRVVAELVT